MYMRAVIYRIVYVGIASAGILLSAAFRQSTVQAAPVAAAAARATAPAPRIVILPTVEVRAAAVRAPTTKARESSPSVAVQVQVDRANDPHAGAAPTFRLDMPYYSLGRVLPRVGKE